MTGARISDFVTGAPHSQSASFANIDEWDKLANGAEHIWFPILDRKTSRADILSREQLATLANLKHLCKQ
jgi:hypothetical protein